MKKLFKLAESNTTVSIELSAGLTTFMAMAYIVFVNPQMMACLLYTSDAADE